MSSDTIVNNQPNKEEAEGYLGVDKIPKSILDSVRKQTEEIHRLATTQAGSDQTQPKEYLDQLEREKEQKDTSQAQAQAQSKESQSKGSQPKEAQAKQSATATQPKEGQSQQKESQPKPKESQPKESSSKPKESSSKPKESSSKPKESSSKPKESSSKPKEKESQPKESSSSSKPKESSSMPKESSSKKEESKPLPKEQPKELTEVTGTRPPADTSQPQDTKDKIGQESSDESSKTIFGKIKDKASELKDSMNGMIHDSAQQQVLPHRPPRVRAVQHAQEQDGLDLQDRHRMIKATEEDMHKEPLDNASMEKVHEHTKQEGLDIFSRLKQTLGLQEKGKDIDLPGKDADRGAGEDRRKEGE